MLRHVDWLPQAKVAVYDPNLANFQLFTLLKNGTEDQHNKARGDILLGPDGYVYAISKYAGSAKMFTNSIFKLSPTDGQIKQQLWARPAVPALRGRTSNNAGDANDIAFKGTCGVAGNRGSGTCVLLVAVATGILRLNYSTGYPVDASNWYYLKYGADEYGAEIEVADDGTVYVA